MRQASRLPTSRKQCLGDKGMRRPVCRSGTQPRRQYSRHSVQPMKKRNTIELHPSTGRGKLYNGLPLAVDCFMGVDERALREENFYTAQWVRLVLSSA